MVRGVALLLTLLAGVMAGVTVEGSRTRPLGVYGVVEASIGPYALLSLQPRLSYRAGIDFLAGNTAQLPSTVPLDVAGVAVQNSVLRRYLGSGGNRLTDADRLALILPVCQLAQAPCATPTRLGSPQ